LLEVALYVVTFNNIFVRYSQGSSLFLADLLTRQFNKVFLGEDEQKISNLWAELQPPIKRENFKATLSPEMLTNLLASSPNEEYLDIFCKQKFYDQSLLRYHTQPQDVMTQPAEPQPIELSFLADLYSGFNGTKMTSQQFHELNDHLQNFPAQSLARKIKNTNLNSLRKTLFELDIH
jgi:hypothetical protein